MKGNESAALAGEIPKIRVLFFDWSIGFGGAIISMSLLANSLVRDAGLDVYVMTAQSEAVMSPLLDGPTYIHFLMPLNYIVRERFNKKIDELLNDGFLKTLLLKGYAVVDELARYCYRYSIFRAIRRHEISLVHTNNGLELDAMIAARLAGVAYVAHSRGLGVIERREAGYTHLDDTLGRVIAISTAVATRCEEAGIPSAKVDVIHNPVDIDSYLTYASQRDNVRKKWGITSSDVVVAIFGRLTKWKGQMEFLQAIELIADRCPNLKALIVGDASDDVHGYQQQVEAFALRERLSGRVIFAGYQQDVAEYYWASDVVVHNSIEAEPFGRVIIEAMACRKPVIAMAEGGPLDIIENNEDGVLVPPRDTPALSVAIEKLYQSEEDRVRLGQAAEQAAREKFGTHQIAMRVLGIYREILAADSDKFNK